MNTKTGNPDPKANLAWPVFWVASLAVFLVSMDGTMLFAAFSALRAGFPNSTAADLSWVLNAYTVVYAAMLIPSGGLADKHGRKKTFLLGVSLFLLASLVCGLAPTVEILVVARAFQAIGAALLTPASLSLVLIAFPKNKHAIVVGLWGAVGALAAAVGPSLGSFVIVSIGWQWAFFINLPLGFVAIWFGVKLLSESTQIKDHQRFDFIGMILLMMGVGALALSIVQADAQNWSYQEKIDTLIFGISSIFGFLFWAKKSRTSLVSLDLFKSKTYSYVNLATFSFGIAFSMMFFTFFFYMKEVWHYPLDLAGLAMTPGPLTVIPVAALSGRIASQHGHRPLLMTGGLIYAMSGLWFLFVPQAEPAYFSHWLPGSLLSGVGVGMILPSLSGAAARSLSSEHYAVGSAVNQAVRQIGSVIGVSITVLLLAGHHLARNNFNAVYFSICLLSLLTMVLSIPVNTRPGKMG